MNISVLSTEYIEAEITASADPTADVVQMAFTAFGADPVSGDWHSAIWETANGVHSAACLVGPGAGGVALPKGIYWIWIRIVDNPEIVVKHDGILRVL